MMVLLETKMVQINFPLNNVRSSSMEVKELEQLDDRS
jgi:hypothetical protein